MDCIDRDELLKLEYEIAVPKEGGAVYRHRCISADDVRNMPSIKPEYLVADLKGQRDHYIKLNIIFADSVSDGQKCFEIRKNDRGYQKGDLVVFKPVDDAGNSVHHPIIDEVYEITYVISGWGLKDGYCVFGIKKQPGRRGVML